MRPASALTGGRSSRRLTLTSTSPSSAAFSTWDTAALIISSMEHGPVCRFRPPACSLERSSRSSIILVRLPACSLTISR